MTGNLNMNQRADNVGQSKVGQLKGELSFSCIFVELQSRINKLCILFGSFRLTYLHFVYYAWMWRREKNRTLCRMSVRICGRSPGSVCIAVGKQCIVWGGTRTGVSGEYFLTKPLHCSAEGPKVTHEDTS